MNKLLTKIVGAALGLSMTVGVGVAVASNQGFAKTEAAPGASPMTSTFNSKSWGVSSGDSWSSDKDGFQYSSGHVQVTSAYTGAGCTSVETYSNISKISVHASTTSKGVGNITVQVGTGSAQTICSLSKTTTADDYELTYSPAVSGKVTLVVNCSTNSMYLDSVTITYSSSTPSLSVDSTASVKKDKTIDLSVSYSNMASGLTISASSDDTDIATVTASRTTSAATGNASFTVSGISQGVVDITFSVTYSAKTYEQICTVSVTDELCFEKITKVADLNKTREGGGRYVIAYSTDNSIVMSTTQNNNNRGQTTATFEDDVMVVQNPSSIAVLNIEKGTGDLANYFTIYDDANNGYLYAVSTSNYLRTSNPQNKTDYYYWSISFSSNHVVITNKGNSFVIRYNSSSSLFSSYNGGQAAIDLYEVDSDIPAYVALSTITAANSTVQEGSTITYSGTYSPTNATESIIVKTLSSTYATAGDVSMSSGTFTVSITGVAPTEGTSLVFEGEDGHGSASVTLVVTSYTATHDLVVSASSLNNGARVVIACTNENLDFIAEHSTGGTNLNGISAGFSADKSTLAATSSQEFVVWCVDSTNGYYVFSDGGYYLTSPTSKNNYLQRTEELSEACYFTIENDADGVIIKNSYGANHGWKDVSSAYTLEFNETTSKFSLYGSSQKAASLYLSKQSLNKVQGFVDVFMHFGNVQKTNTSDTNACRDSGTGSKNYFVDAMNAFNNDLSEEDREDFVLNYDDAFERLDWWAKANGYSFDTDTFELYKTQSINLIKNSTNDAAAIISVIAVLSLSAVAGFFMLRKRKEQ